MNSVTVSSIIDTSKSYQFVNNGEPSARGGMKDVYFSPDRAYVVAIYRDKLDFNSTERLKKITTQYFDSFFKREGGAYYEKLYAWPTDVVKWGERIGIIVPCFRSDFFFKKGYAASDILKGGEKEGKWFASAKFRTNSRLRLDDSELGDWLSYFQICVNIARGVKRLHSAGLAHSDLSYKNVLIDPVSKSASIIDIDGLVVPGLFPPDVIGTADFIAPEVMATKHLGLQDPNRNLPKRTTDLHALAVLIYMYLLYRHPLRGGRYFGDIDSDQEEDLLMGKEALFIEHPKDDRNRNFKREYGDQVNDLEPWTDLKKTPYTLVGPYLSDLFEQAFIQGLHDPNKRPPADSWEQALVKTNDLKLKCSNPKCQQKWFIYINTQEVSCPFCQTQYNESIPILDFYAQHKPGQWKPTNMRLVIYSDTTLHKWHTSSSMVRNERLTPSDKKRVGYFSWHNQKWMLVNDNLGGLKDVSDSDKSKHKTTKIGEHIELKSGMKLLLSNDDHGLLAVVSLANQKQ